MLTYSRWRAENILNLKGTNVRQRRQLYEIYKKEQKVPQYMSASGDWIIYGATPNSLAPMPSASCQAVPSTKTVG